MTGDEFRTALRALRVNQRRFARMTGTAATTVNRWVNGSLSVPGYAACVVRLLRLLPPKAISEFEKND